MFSRDAPYAGVDLDGRRTAIPNTRLIGHNTGMAPQYGDRRLVGRSRRVPFRRGEAPMDRHSRRRQLNLDNQEAVCTFAERHGVEITIKNNGHHWILIKGGNRLEWWPSSAKMVWNQRWADGVHVHDYEQFIEQARKLFQLPSEATED